MNDNLMNAPYARQLNNIFFRVGATEEARKQLIPENMEKMKKEFQYMHPYVQSVILQSVIFLTSEQFIAIEKDYRELIAIAQSCDDEWVKNVSARFQNYPNIVSLSQEGDGQFNYSGLSSFVTNNSNVDNIGSEIQTDSVKLNTNNNYKVISVDPPSKSFQPKSLSEAQKDSITTDHFYSAPPKRIPTLPKPPPTTTPVSAPINLPPREAKKEKTVHSVEELKSSYFNQKSTKKKTQLTLFHAFNS